MPKLNVDGKITPRDEAVARVLKWLPLFAFLVVTLPAPIVFLLLFLASAATDTAAVYLFLTVFGAALGAGAACYCPWPVVLSQTVAISTARAAGNRWYHSF